MKTDFEIQKDVLEELKWEPFLKASEIGVAVKNGVVTLSGTVDSYLKKSGAEKAAKRVAGVKAVAEDIEIKYGNSFVKNDTELAETILNSLKWHSALNEEKIKIKVENGIVTLDGEVEWEFQRNSAAMQIENLVGVKKIINNISIKPAIVSKELKQKVTAAFHRNASLDADKISIEVKGNLVVLTGKVRSWAERSDAESAVWSAPGVNMIENKIKVETEELVF
jgi:osmotically-inducible protein OsmY